MATKNRKEYFRKYYQDNKERIRATNKDWVSTHQEEDKARKKNWAEANPDKIKSSWQKHYKKIFGSTKDYKLAGRYKSMAKRSAKNNRDIMPIDEFIQWWNQQPKHCEYCGITGEELSKRKTKNTLQVERKDNSIGYVPQNICLACWRCNHTKSDFYTYDQWKEIAERFIKPKLMQYQRLL